MNKRDLLFLVGTLLTGIATPAVALSTNSAGWWAGIICGAAGAACMATRSILKGPKE